MATATRSPSVSIAYWLAALLLVFGLLAFLTDKIVIPGVPNPEVNLKSVEPLLFVVVILLGTKLLLSIMKPLFRAGLRDRFRTEADVFSIFQIVSYVAWIGALGFATYVVLGGNFAEIGVLGGAVVFGVLLFILQEPLLNFVGWAILITRRVYKLGDRIEVNNTKGYVVAISTMNTTVREFGGWMSRDTFTGRYATIPNKSVMTSAVFNYTKDTPYIWTEILVSITYESNLRRAEDIILEAANEIVGDLMRDNKESVREKYEFRDLATYVIEEPTVRWRMKDSWVELGVVFFCPAYRKGYYESEVTKRILEKISDEPNVQIAYPHNVSVPFARTVPHSAIPAATLPPSE
ncbi:MAG TPA: mechanosensitive ion channel family protein [Thermoplasmata archaeon]|nr:mechanosensitive ion channel family protein [Thermoplasmata archaeon]